MPNFAFDFLTLVNFPKSGPLADWILSQWLKKVSDPPLTGYAHSQSKSPPHPPPQAPSLPVPTPLSPWYNRTGWLGVKHQLTYLPTPPAHLLRVSESFCWHSPEAEPSSVPPVFCVDTPFYLCLLLGMKARNIFKHVFCVASMLTAFSQSRTC